MMAPPDAPLRTSQPTPTGTLEQTDPIWCHVKTEWDHQFVKRANFIPWLRAQLQVDPIDETASSPETLLNYVKRRLALAQNQQRLRESANNGQSTAARHSTSTALVNGPSNTTNVNGLYLDPNQGSSFTTHGSFSGGPANFPSSASPQSSDRAPLTNGHQLYDHGLSHSSRAANTQLLTPVHAPSLSYSEPSQVSTGVTFSSQLGAIADAHMGNSLSMLPASSGTSGSQVNGFHSAPNDLGETKQYHPSDGSAHPYQSSPIHFLHDQALSNGPQQQQLQPLSLLQQSSLHLPSYPSSYANHHDQSDSTLTFTAAHSHPLQPHNVNQYSHTLQSVKVPPYEQFVDTRQKLYEHQENSFPSNDPKLDLAGSAFAGQSNDWNSAPVRIDPALFAGFKTNHSLLPQTSDDALPPISPAVDVPLQPTTASAGNLSPRRTRSAAALLKKNVSTPTAPSNTTKRTPEFKTGAASIPLPSQPAAELKSLDIKPSITTEATPSSTEGNTRQAGANSGTYHSPSNTSTNRKTTLETPAHRNPVPADQYNRKAWSSRLANVRVELDHIAKAPSRSAIKLVKTLSMFSISPTPSSGDWSTVPLEGRIEVLSAIKTTASQDFYDAWAHESKGLAMLEAWLKGAVQAHEKAKTNEGGNPVDAEAARRETLLINLLQTLAKLALTVENLQNHAFAKLVLRINKEQNSIKFSTEVKRVSTLLEQKWRVMARVAKTGGENAATSTGTVATVAESKKRQEVAIESNHGKKRKVETTRVPIVPTPSSSKGTINLFGRPDKSKLPAFTKKVLEPTPAPPVVQDTFAEAMGLLKGRSASSTSAEPMSLAANPSGKPGGKPAKRVRFMADNELCQIRIVERLVYEGEEYETHPVGDARKMDAVEGKYLHSSDKFLEEEMEWETPFEVLLTSETISNLETSPLVSAEAAAQEEREKGLAEVTYGDECPIPETPHEPVDPGQPGGDAQSTHFPKMMKLGDGLMLDPEVSHLIAKAQADNSMDAPLAMDHTVSDLLARLGRGGSALPESSNQTPLSTNPSSMLNLPQGFDINFLNSISQGASLQALLANSANVAMPLQPVPTTQAADPFPTTTRDNGWGAAAGSASRNRDQTDPSAPYIPTGPSAGVSRNKRRKKGKDGSQPRIPAHDSFGRHIKCKWWPNCPHGSKCFYKHG